MESIDKLKIEIEEFRYLLDAAASDLDAKDCNCDSLLNISTTMDKLILDFIKAKD